MICHKLLSKISILTSVVVLNFFCKKCKYSWERVRIGTRPS